MSKKEVLTQVYPDELDYIFDKKREQELKRYMGYFNQIMAVSAGFGGGDSAKEYVKEIASTIEELSNNKDTDKKTDIRELHSEYEELKKKDDLSIYEEKRLVELKHRIDEYLDRELSKLMNLRKR